jgi:HAD superfamily hydrolase (TIGR01457 family)
MTLLDRYDCFLLDLDGVVVRGDAAVPGAPETLRLVRKRGKGAVFVTNNSSRTPEDVARRLTSVGIDASPEDVVTSALATASMLAAEGTRTAFVVGEEGISAALRDSGMDVLGGEATSADVVVVGWDRRVDFAKLRTACLLVQRGSRLVATNADPSYPAPEGLVPGAGALLAAITTTTGAIPTVVGKPQPELFRAALAAGGGGRALIVGDRLETDIAGAAALGWDSLLVLTGVARAEDVATADPRPTFVGEDLGALDRDLQPIA